ncbi:MAG: polysaccharide biosynthesis/export family protein [Acidobacteriaceae bacterium]|nr:polysaccharide biosynthesis/export family protein [Acidobacteriaceae bacterium]
MQNSFFGRKLTLATIGLFFCFSGMALGQETPAPTTPPPSEQKPVTPNQTPPAGQSKPASGPSTGPAGGAPVDSNSYKVGPSDVLSIRVWNEPEFSGPVAVQQNGNITMPLIGDLPAGGKTPVEIQDLLAKALTKYVVKPLVTVTVQDVGSKKYYIDGLIARPGEYPMISPITILEAISKAGGLQDFANAKHIYILRGDKRIYFNYKDVLRGKHMEQNIPIEPGDHIVIP